MRKTRIVESNCVLGLTSGQRIITFVFFAAHRDVNSYLVPDYFGWHVGVYHLEMTLNSKP